MIVGSISVNINTPDFNYGAILHSWAFQQYVKKIDFVDYMEVIDYTTPYLEKKHRFFPWIDLFKEGKITHALRAIKRTPAYLARYYKFHRFEKQHMVCSKPYTQATLSKAQLPYDVIVCESDIIWNPKLCDGKYDPAFFAALPCFKKMKKIAYSPSLGDSMLSKEYAREFKDLLKNLDHISCRESYAKKIIEEHSEKNVTHVLDPVLLLDPSDYECITAPRITADKYLLLYLPVNDNEKLRYHAQQYAKQHHLKILEISTRVRKRPENDINLVAAGVEEFLSAIKNASCVFTNSFHAICFSIIFSVEFYAFTRNVPGKVRDICKTLGLPERFLEDNNFIQQPPINFAEVHAKWISMRNESQSWLLKALST